MKKIAAGLVVAFFELVTFDVAAKCENKRNLTTDYEVSISNNTKKTMHWHLETSGTDCNEDLEPGKVKNFFVTGGDLLQRFEVDFKEEGEETETRGYNIPSANAGRDWLFSIDGEPFTGNWTVCGMWKATSAQGSLSELGPMLVSGITAAAIIVGTYGVGTGAGAAEYAASVAALEAGQALLLASQLGTAAVVTLAAAGAGSAAAFTDELTQLAEEMTLDKCEWVYNKRVTIKNGSSDYMMVIKDNEKSVGVLPGKSVVVREALANDKIKVWAYLESKLDSISDETVPYTVAKFQEEDGVVRVYKENKKDVANDVHVDTTFYNYTDMPVKIVREQNISEPVEILAAKEIDASGKEVIDSVQNTHDAGDDFRYYIYTDEKPITQEITISWDKGDATLTVNGTKVESKYSK